MFDEGFLRAGLSAVIEVDSRTGKDGAARPVAVSSAAPASALHNVIEQ